MSSEWAVRARWVLPIVGDAIAGGTVRVRDGRISDVGDAAPAGAIDLGDAAILPGFINVHTHLELTGYAGRLAPMPFWDWLPKLIALRRAPGAEEKEIDAARQGAAASLAGGVTCVADISRTGRPFEALMESPIRKVCFFELISGASDPPRDPDELRAAVDRFAEEIEGRNDSTVGVSPHTFYTVAWDDIRRTVALAGERDLPITMHFAETLEEVEWLESGSGRLAEFLAAFPTLRPFVLAHGDGMGLLHRAMMVRLRPLLAHCNYVSDAQIEDLARTSCSVVFCPRAHRFFGHAPHRWRDMLRAGVNVCVGTDSLASNESLSILDELRFLRREAPDMPATGLIEMATARGAKALGMHGAIGALQPGAWADMVAIPLGGKTLDPAAAILDSDARVSRVWVGGGEVLPS